MIVMKRTAANQTSSEVQSIINERLKMTVEEQSTYRNAHWSEIHKAAKSMDERWEKMKITLTEDEIAALVSETRKQNYEASNRH